MSTFADKSQAGRGNRSLSSQAAERMRRRRDMAFIKYGSDQKKQNPALLSRTREHAKMIAMKLSKDVSSPMSIQSTSTFADFGSAFASFNPSEAKSSATRRRDFFADNGDPFNSRNADDSFHSESSSSFFGDDAFAPTEQYQPSVAKRTPQRSTTARQSTPSIKEENEFDAFATNWPSNNDYESSISMPTLPANSSMQARFAQHNELSTPERSPQLSISEAATSSGGGAAARRRMRRQMRSSGSKPSFEHAEQISTETTPQSPQTMRRHHITADISSSTRKQTDHVSNYSVQHNQRHPSSFANRSSHSSESGSESNVWDRKQANGGFTFDAFGLDAVQINQQVSAAINELAGSEHSFFENSHNGWDSPVVSRSSTPNPSDDGFVDIRVNNQHSHSVHVRQSPTSTERSSLTDEFEKSEQATSINLFKEKAGFQKSPGRGHKIVRPEVKESSSGETDGFRGRLQRQFTAQRASYNKAVSPQYIQSEQTKKSTPSLTMHVLEETQMAQLRREIEPGISSPRSKQDVEFYDSDERASDTSETGISTQSHADVASGKHSQAYSIPYESKKPAKDTIPDNLTESTSATTLEEKKDDEHMRSSESQLYRTEEQLKGKSRAQWQDRNVHTYHQPHSVDKAQSQMSRAYMQNGDSNSSEEKLTHILSPSPPKKTWGQPLQTTRSSPTRPYKGNGDDIDVRNGGSVYPHTSAPATSSRPNQFSQIDSKSSTTSPGSSPQPSWMIARERILAAKEKDSEFTMARGMDNNERKTTKSEGGATVKHSHLNSILSRMSVQTPTDSKSDAGASPPAFLGVQLKMSISASDSDKNVGKVVKSISDDSNTQNGVADRQEERKMSYAERRQIEIQQEKERAAKMAEEALTAGVNSGKLTYRERRELEIRKQQEDEARQNHDTQEKDVASLIKKRIAANKKNLKLDEQEKKTSSVPNYRDVLKPSINHGHESVKINGHYSPKATNNDHPRDSHSPTRSSNYHVDGSVEKSVSPSRTADRQPRATDHSPLRTAESGDQLNRHASDTSSSPARSTNTGNTESTPPRRTNLVIETESKVSRIAEEPNAALSHMLMLQKLQQRGLSKESAASPARPTGPSSPRADNGDDQTRSSKAHTPKATMMMLNAFLAGKESVSSPRGSALSPQEEAQEEAKKPDQEPALNGLPALKDDPKYTRFFKMLKVGMPMDVVKHAMTREGLDPSVMDGDHNKPAGIPLKLDPTYSKYFRMLSIGLPMEAVKHAMARDGLEPAVMDQDHDLPATAIPKPTKETDKEQDSHRRARLHWNPLRKVTRNSLWAKIDQEDNIQIDIDEEEFQELFQVEKTAETAAKATKQEGAKRTTVRVIDPKRANNGGIILARLKMSHDEMADAVDRIDEYAMNAEQIENMIEYLPTKNERKALESYMLEGGQDAAEKFDGLCECEKFMVSMMTVKHAKRKVRALLFKLQFETFVRDIQKEAFLVEAACDELSNSVRLRQLLGIILEFGNRLNTAGSANQQKAGAFTIDSLLKLKQAKAFDKKTTFLEYVIRIVNRNNELLLRFEDDIPTVFKADKVSWEQCIGDLEEVENQLENVRRMALYQARHTHAYGLKKKSHKDDDESLSDAEEEFSLEEEVEALKSTQIGLFTLSAIKYISALRDKVEETKYKFSSLLEYFGEDNKNKQPHEIFSTFVKFCRDFNQAKEHVFSEEKKKQREERKRQAKKAVGPSEGKPPAYTPVKAQAVHQRTATPVKTPPSHSMIRTSDHQPSLSGAMTYSSARTLEVSPQPPEQSNEQRYEYHEPQQSEDEMHRPPSTMYTDYSGREQSYQAHHAESYESEVSASESSSSPPAMEPSQQSNHMASMRAKARMRRRVTGR